MSIVHQNSGRLKTSYDKRDKRFSHSSKFGSVAVFPKTLGRVPFFIFDQKQTQFCVPYSIACAISYRLNKIMSPDYQVAMTGQYIGKTVIENGGTDPREGMLSQLNFGSLPIELAPFSLEKDGPSIVAKWENWRDLIPKATEYAQGSFYWLDDPYLDIFDDIRSALVLGKDENAIINCGSRWYAEWNKWNGTMTKSDNIGIVPTEYTTPIANHEYTFIDFTEIKGTPYLVAQLSQGKDFGLNGLLFFPREVVNREFAYEESNLKIFRAKSPNFLIQMFWSWQDIIVNILKKLLILRNEK